MGQEAQVQTDPAVPTEQAAAITTGEIGIRTVALAGLLEQSNPTELKPLPIEDVRELINNWRIKHNDGEGPDEGEEATSAALKAYPRIRVHTLRRFRGIASMRAISRRNDG